MAWYPKWCWGGPSARIVGDHKSERALEFFGMHWGILTIGKWRLVKFKHEYECECWDGWVAEEQCKVHGQ